ncbi:hypothetical protein ACHQM5_006443 [Ranunculus cassubicifolius]
MERIPAACAMQWSIELEKGLRSNKPGQPTEAILQIGSRLEQWSKESDSTMVISNIYGLVPGEDRLFANTILLRLAEAFKSGDNLTRNAILNVFILERNQHKKAKQYKGILSKQRVANHVELLKRAKIVYDTGDVESKAMTLRLLGCWSDFAKDSAEIRHMVLLSLGSSHGLEVKASIFTAGCFSELSQDFAYIFLEVLINKVTSSTTPNSVKLACAKAFAKMGCSLPLASRAHKIGRKLVLNSSEEDFSVEMLVSLSKLASKSMLLIAEQVEFLLSSIMPNSALRVQSMAIRCILFLTARGVCCFPINASLLAKLFHVLNGTTFSTISQCEALRILLKIFQSTLPNFSFIEIPEIVTWMDLVENDTQSPFTRKRLLALHLMVDISLKCRKDVRRVSGGNISTDFPARVVLLILDQIEKLENSVASPCEIASKLAQECETLLNHVICIVKEFPDLGGPALNKTKSCIDSLVNVRNRGTAVLKVVFCMYTFVEHYLETLNEVGAITVEVLQIVKLILEVLHKTYFSNHDKCSMRLILLHSRVTLNYLANSNVGDVDYWIEHERHIHQFVKKKLARQDNWAAYKSGKCLACQGAWFAAAFTFGQLVESVQSNAYQSWLKSLSLFAKSESTIMVLFRPNKVQIDEIWGTRYRIPKENIEDSFSEAYKGVSSASELLNAVATADQNFIFQRWFLKLRAKILQVLVDVLRLFQSNTSNMQQNIDSFTLLSLRLKMLAQELDLLAISFMDMDLESCRSISTLALDCSLLAFCTGFVLYIPSLHSHGKSSQTELVQNLAERLWHLDSDMSTNLMQISTLVGEPESCIYVPHRVPLHKAGPRIRETLDVCKFALSSFLQILKDANGTKYQRMQIMSNVLKRWMTLSFHIPKYFFQVKSCVGAELFVFNADTRTPHGLFVNPGFHLSLNLCLQLKHVPRGQVSKVHCILASKPSHWTPESKGKVGSGSEFLDIFNDRLNLNEKLWASVTEEGAKRRDGKLGKVCSGDGLVCSFVSFVLNEGGQGFSSCLLDVSAFPVGSYRMKWLSCCIDSKDSCWSLVPLNMGPIFSVKESVAG